MATLICAPALLGFVIAEGANERLFFGAVLLAIVNIALFQQILSMGVTHSCCIGLIFVSGIFGSEIFGLMGGLGLFEALRSSGTIPIVERPWATLFSINLNCIAALLLAWAMRFFLRRKPLPTLFDMLDGDRRCVDFVLLAALVPTLGSALEPFLPATAVYSVKILAAGLNVVPFFAGRVATRSRVVRWSWMAGLAVNAGVLLLLGGRFLALFPVVIFFIGYATGLSSTKRWLVFGVALAATLPGYLFVGALGMIRDDLGRDDRSNVSHAYFSRMVEAAQQIFTSGQQQSRIDVFGNGLARLVPWSNFAPVSMSPEIVPYRGFSTFGAEMWNACSIYALAPKSREEMVDLKMGTMAATDYGYNISENYSTEWGVMADGWSRAGLLGGAAFVFFSIGGILALEVIVLRLKSIRPAVKIFAVALLMERCVRLNSVPLLELMRTTALYFVLSVPAFWGVNRLLHSLFPEPAPLLALRPPQR